MPGHPTRPAARPWTFLSNHAHVLICLAADPGARARGVARRLGLTVSGVQRILAELEAGGYVRRARGARPYRYAVNQRRPLGHPLVAHRTVRDLVRLGLDGVPTGR